ncbi:MAG: hypothetical protein ACHP78_10810 [Terriglobales bacterium]
MVVFFFELAGFLAAVLAGFLVVVLVGFLIVLVFFFALELCDEVSPPDCCAANLGVTSPASTRVRMKRDCARLASTGEIRS